VCSQSNNEETFTEFDEGVIEIYASVGYWVCFVLVVSFVDGFRERKFVSLMVVREIPIDH